MSPAVPTEPTLPESSTVASSTSLVLPEGSTSDNLRFTNLRGVRWRIALGILPSSSSSSVDDLRRVTADSRRRYAALRRRLLVDPQIPKDGSSSPDLVIDNPLSQSPDSVWGRFFRNAELERMVDQDLSRLYPDHGSYFQTPECQSMLRRILLLWCIVHLEYGYRQGMHELLAPLLYVLHSDVEHLSQVRKLYEDHFIDKFDGFTFHENDLTYDFDFKKLSNSTEDETASQKCPMKVSSLDELDLKIQDIVLLSDAYGAEGELGAVLSEKFMEHDTYCMFDALMSGAGGAVATAEFFSPSPLGSSHTGLTPVIEASSALYHLLSIVDASLHSHLIELGVEPQYFALRWLRVLFGREFSLEDLLIIWDEIFASDNSQSNKCVDDAESSFGVLNSSRGAFISAVAVSMILYMRSSLLATEHATSCLQRLLNFPRDVNLKKIIGKAKSLQALAMDANNSKPLPLLTGALDRRKSDVVRGYDLSLGSVSPRAPPTSIPESYWEEKWRNLHKAEELTKSSLEKQVPNRKKGWSEKVRLNLSRTASTPAPSKVDSSKIGSKLSVRRSLLEDLSRQLGLEEDSEKIGGDEDFGQQDTTFTEVEEEGQGTTRNNFSCTADERCLSGNVGSEENSSIFSESPSPNDPENQSARSSVASNLSIEVNDHESNIPESCGMHVEDSPHTASNLSIEVNDHESNIPESCGMHVEDSPLPVSDAPEDVFEKSGLNKDSIEETTARLDSSEDVSLKSGHNSVTMEKSMSPLKEQRKPSGKFQWFLKFGWNSGEGTSGKGLSGTTKPSNDGPRDQDNVAASSMVTGPRYSSPSGNVDTVDQNVMSTLRNLSQSMLENIQVIESVFQQERGQVGSLENFSKNVLVGKGQVTAMTALKELRKISNLLSEM